MSKALTIAKAFASTSALPGLLFTLMGLGLLPVDEKMAKMAAPFIQPLGIPFRPFSCLLGSCKILGSLSLWGIGPMPELVARIGLMFSAACGAYGHIVVGESPIPPIVYIGVVGSIFVLEKAANKGKKE